MFSLAAENIKTSTVSNWIVAAREVVNGKEDFLEFVRATTEIADQTSYQYTSVSGAAFDTAYSAAKVSGFKDCSLPKAKEFIEKVVLIDDQRFNGFVVQFTNVAEDLVKIGVNREIVTDADGNRLIEGLKSFMSNRRGQLGL